MKALQLFFYVSFLFLLVAPLVSSSDLTIPFNKLYDIKRPCFNNGSFCSSGGSCNFTMLNPLGEVVIANGIMTFNESFWNYTLLQTQNQILGESKATMMCCDGAFCGADTFDIDVTADGFKSQIFPTQFVIIIFSFILIGGGLAAERLRMMKHIGSILLIIMGVITLYPGYSFINYSTLLGKALGFAFIGMGFYFWIEDNFSREKQQDLFDQNPEEIKR